MSEKSKNGKFVNLDNARIYYNAKEDSIEITSVDEDLVGKPFHIKLNKGTETEQTLRELLTEKGVIKAEQANAVLPKFLKYPPKDDLYSEWNLIPVGGTNDGAVYWDVRVRPNALIVGRAGSGKTVFLQNLILHTAIHKDMWNVFGIDFSGYSLKALEQTPSVFEVATDYEDATAVIDNVTEILEHRFKLMQEQHATTFLDVKETSRKTKAIMLIIDEAFLLFNPVGLPEEYASAKAEVLHQLGNLVRRGRAAGVFVVLASQKVDETTPNAEFRANLGARFVTGWHSPYVNDLMLGDSGTPHGNTPPGRVQALTEGLLLPKGSQSDKDVTSFQTFFTSTGLSAEKDLYE